LRPADAPPLLGYCHAPFGCDIPAANSDELIRYRDAQSSSLHPTRAGGRQKRSVGAHPAPWLLICATDRLGGIIDIVRGQRGDNDLALSASMPICRLRQDRRVFAPCLSTGHSPAPHGFSPVLAEQASSPLVARAAHAAEVFRIPKA